VRVRRRPAERPAPRASWGGVGALGVRSSRVGAPLSGGCYSCGWARAGSYGCGAAKGLNCWSIPSAHLPRVASRAGDHAFEDARRVAQAGPDDRRLAYVHSLIITALSSPWLRRTPPPRAPLSTKSTIRSVSLAWPSTPRAPPAASPPTASHPSLRRVLEPPSSPRRCMGSRLVLSQPSSRLSRRRDACLKLSSFWRSSPSCRPVTYFDSWGALVRVSYHLSTWRSTWTVGIL